MKRGGDAHAMLDLKCWQLLCLAWIHRAADVSKTGAGGSRAWNRLDIVRDNGSRGI